MEKDHIDEELYSRQLYVIGHEAMAKMMVKHVLVIGADGLGQEICKNVILAGINTLIIHDNIKISLQDLGAGFLFKEKDVGESRAEAIVSALGSYNKYVKVGVMKEDPTINRIIQSNFSIVVSVNQEKTFDCYMDSKLHDVGIKFISVTARGLFGRLFVDAVNHTIIDTQGTTPDTGMINDVSYSGIVTLADGYTHRMYKGDFVSIDDMVGNRRVFSVTNRFSNKSFQIKDLTKITNTEYQEDFSMIASGAQYVEKRFPIDIFHDKMTDALKNPNDKIVRCNFSYENDLYKLFDENKNDAPENLLKEFQISENLLLMPVCSVMGGIAAQEVIKLASHKFIPLNQIFYFHSPGIFKSDGVSAKTDRYFHMRKVVGDEAFEKLAKTSIFMVGAGAIGCEHLKNVVMTGISHKSHFALTDMDSIEISNLNRQFLFKEKDVGRSKAEAAALNACQLNPDYEVDRNISYWNTSVKTETENVFTDSFLLKKNVVLLALDNVSARSYMDTRCVCLEKVMIDAGTLGTLGHIQVIIPHMTESYNSTTDAEQNSIPMCTVKSFPSAIEHTIEWALTEFKEKFNESIFDVSTEEDEEEDENAETKVFTLRDTTVVAKNDLLKLATDLFDMFFTTSIEKLLKSFPPDYVNKEGGLFWSPPKKIPIPIRCDFNDPLHLLFVESATLLFSQVFSCKVSRDEIHQMIFSSTSLPLPQSSASEEKEDLISVEFEKDDPLHADFIYAAANIRARNYSITEASKHNIIGVAGKIVPAIATTTAVVSGLATLEIIKCVVNSSEKIGFYSMRNSFIDLASFMVSNVEPVKPETSSYPFGQRQVEINLWSKKVLDDDLLKNIIEVLKNYYMVEVSMVNYKNSILWWDSSHSFDGNLDKKISDIVNTLDGQIYVELFVMYDDDVERENVFIRIN